MIPQEIIDNIILNADIAGTISDYIRLDKSGANFKSICPFHEDRDASLVVSPAKRIWKCFGCGAGGNVISFVQQHENISFPEAVKTVGNKYQISVPEKELSDKEKAEMQRRESLFIALDFAQEYFSSKINTPEAQKYLKNRAIPEAILKEYGAGYAFQQDHFNTLYREATRKGYSKNILSAAGLINEKENKTYDRFIRRITFPFYSLSGKVIGFTGRDIEADAKIKYINSPDTELFSKSNILFGLYQARKHITAQDKCYLVEGQFDVFAFAANGIPNTVCGSGTALTAAQASMLRKFTKNVTVVYDGDAAGMKASLRNIDILLKAGINVRAALLPQGEDPDSFANTQGEKKLTAWLKKNETDFISFVCIAHQEELNDPIHKTRILQLIAESIACVPAQLQRENYISNLATRFHIDAALLKNLVINNIAENAKKQPGKNTENTKVEPIVGLHEAQDFLGTGKKELTVTFNQAIYAADWGAKPTVFITADLESNDIQELRAVSYVLVCRDNLTVDEQLNESLALRTLRTLATSGFSITIVEQGYKYETNADGERKRLTVESQFGFFEHYMQIYSQFRNQPEHLQSKVIKRCAELISHIDSTTRNLKIKDYAASLGVTKGALEAIVKPHIDRRKSENKFLNDAIDDDESIHFNPNTMPDYVDEDPEIRRMFQAHGFFPLLDKNNRKTAYIFQMKNTLVRVGNFYIEPLLHVYDKTSENNKRIVQLNQRRVPYPIYMEWISKEMITMQTFRQRLWEEGDITFSNGSQEILNTLNESWEGKFRKCTELRMYGHFDEGFFAFSNGIFHEVDGEFRFDEIDDLGLVQHNDLNYYIPAFSKIYINEHRDSDRYYLDRFMMYRERKIDFDFSRWANLMDEVYKYNNNGKWAILYAFMCMFRSDIFEVDRIFTALFFIGPTGSGKSEIAYSIRSLFMPREAPPFDLNSGTSAAMFTLMEKYRNIPLMLEEYNDQQIDDIKFQSLKAAVYAGEGRQKRKDASTKEIDSSEVNTPLIIMGQESPQRDDNSLFNRCIVCEVPKKDDRTKHEDDIFRELKNIERAGLHNILLQVLPKRAVVRQHYTRIQREVYRELKDSIQNIIMNTDGLSRILNTSSMFLAICKIIEKHTDLQLPFTFEEFFQIAREKVLSQVESISSSNRLYAFFSSISTLIDKDIIKADRDFKIEEKSEITLQKQGKETYLQKIEPGVRLLHINISSVHYEYQRAVGKEALSLQSLRNYLRSHESYIGQTRATRFNWKESVETEKTAAVYSPDGEPIGFDPTMVRKIVNLTKVSASVVLNYNVLTDLLDVDYERLINTDDYEISGSEQSMFKEQEVEF